MTFADLARGDSVFVDANIFTYHFQPHGRWGAACTLLLQQIEQQQVVGYTSSDVISEVSHRLMTIEAHKSLGWQLIGIGNRLRTNPAEVRKLTLFRTSVEKLLQGKIQVLPVTSADLAVAIGLCQQRALLANDGLMVAVMQAYGLTNIASNDDDFDRVPGITRYAPA